MSDGNIRLGIQIRTQGPQSDAAIMVACAEAAERAGLDDIVVVDHIAIPPDDIEGSGGRYLDPLGALLFLAAKTSRIGLGTGVLVLPFESPDELAQRLADWVGIGATAVIHGGVRYADAAEFNDAAIALSEGRNG